MYVVKRHSRALARAVLLSSIFTHNSTRPVQGWRGVREGSRMQKSAQVSGTKHQNF